MTAPASLAGLRVLVVEDEMTISLLIEDILADEQCHIVGPYHRLNTAMAAARQMVIDIAILDINLAGEKAFPIAEILEARGIPFLFLSGYGATALPPGSKDWRICTKPFRVETLVEMLRQQIGNHNR